MPELIDQLSAAPAPRELSLADSLIRARKVEELLVPDLTE